MECNLGSPEVPVWVAGRHCWSLDARALIMGIVNVTPDSFSDGGKYSTVGESISAALRLVNEGADILDIGGESTRPGAKPVSVEEELARVIPVIEGLCDLSRVAISVDTCKAEVARKAVKAGACIVNDVSGLRDPRMLEFCASSDCGIAVMHMKGTPESMQSEASYRDVVPEMQDYFNERFETLVGAGISANRIVFDPGIGFGKTLEHNLELLGGLEKLRVHNRPLLIGVSRKSFIGSLLGVADLESREAPTQVLTAFTRSLGAMVHRVHLVRENREALRMMESAL